MSCCSTDVAASIPAPDATGVPLDIRPLLVFSAWPCEDPWTSFVAELVDEAETVLATDTFGAEDLPGMFLTLSPDADLAPNQAYRVRVSPSDGFGGVVEIPFQAGEGYAEPVEALAPELRVHSAERERGEASWRIRSEGAVFGDANPEGQRAYFLLDGEHGVVAAAVPGPEGLASFRTSLRQREPADQVCLRAYAEDGAGSRGPLSEERCRVTERVCGTASGAGSLATAAIGLFALAWRRRAPAHPPRSGA